MLARVLAATLLVLAGCSQARDGSEPPDGGGGRRPDASEGGGASATAPRLNEILRKPPKDTAANLEIHEFIEIKGDPSADYSGYAILQIRGQGDPGEPGQVRSVHPIGMTDASGLWSTGYLEDTLKNSTETFLLVEGFTGAGAGIDLDTDDDGTLDVQPWTRIVDGLALEDDSAAGPTHTRYATVVLVPGFDGNADEVEGASRKPGGIDTQAASDWARNDPDGAGLPGLTGTPVPGEALSTMGMPNELVPGEAPPAAVINELVFNHNGTDTAEYVELLGPANANLSALTIVVLESDTADPGMIDVAIAAGQADASGRFTTALLNSVFENNSQTVLLVAGFSASVGVDLDTDDDGTLDVEPWTAVLDAVAIRDTDAGDPAYANATVLAPDFDGGTTIVGGASRIPDGTDTGAPGDWIRNDFDGEGLPFGTAGTTTTGEARNTPGLPNLTP